MEFNYEEAKSKLTRKLVLFVGLAILFTIIATVAFDDVGFFYSIVFGLIASSFFYLPGRIKGILNVGWIAGIIIVMACAFALVFVMEKLGEWIGIIFLLLPLADIGYSIYKLVSAKKNL